MKNVVNVDLIDKEQYRLHAGQHWKTSTALSDLMADGFGAFYKYQPMIKPEVEPDRQLNKQIIEQLFDLNEYKQLRNFTKGDINSSVEALNVVEKIWNNLPAAVKGDIVL